MGHMSHPTSTAQAVGARIRALRNARRMSIHVLASRADLDTSNLSKIERGESETSLERYRSIAEALEVPLDRLFRQPRRAA